MRELNCVIRPYAGGWCLIIRNSLQCRFHNKNEALRAAIIAARKGRAAGFYTAVKVQHGSSTRE